MAIEILSLLVAGAGASYGWWVLQRRREAMLGLRELEAAMDSDATVAFSVATHAMTSRGHGELWSLHLLYGLLQDERFTGTIRELGGDPDAIETRALALLDGNQPAQSESETAVREALIVINRAYLIAHHNRRKITTTDLWVGFAESEAAKLVVASGVEFHDLLFLLVHGMKPPELDTAGRTDVHVVLRNDDYTTQDFVTWILCDVFGLPEGTARTRMLETHTQGKSIVGRYKLAVAKDKLISVRARAREEHFPLWIGIEDC